MTIWNKQLSIKEINDFLKDTLIDHLGIKITKLTHNGIKGEMPIDKRTVQPYKVLHGGASVAFAESLGSIASNLLLDHEKSFAVGQSVNANHLRPASSGSVLGEAVAIHMGKKSHVWEIKLTDENDRLLCVSRLTMSIIEK